MPQFPEFGVINMFGGPGAGKTTSALGLTAALKERGIEAEFVPEYARELVFDGKLKNTPQGVIFDEQLKRLERLRGKVQFAVTDSPLLMQAVYTEDATLLDRIESAFASFSNTNVFVRNARENHSMVGRMHNATEASELDAAICRVLWKNGVDFMEVPKGDVISSLMEKL